MIKKLLVAQLVIHCLSFGTLALAQGAGAMFLDQFNLANSETELFGLGATNSNWQQEITAGANGYLTVVDLRIFTPGTFNFYVTLGSAWQSGPYDFQATNSASSPGWFAIDVSSANIRLSVGDHYVIGANGIGTSHPYLAGDQYDAYSGGSMWGELSTGGVMDFSNWELGFQTYLTPIPEPSVVGLSIIAVTLFSLHSRAARFKRCMLPNNPHGGANGEQPFGSATNRTSSAAAPRRSP